ncbi:hypothetical protein [Streptosporangium sp. NPDC049304]|uniref:hypothetical protein n=1 Tax=Streptosporangium sp. NPDC049304 TaxID=3154830 RepID=UPI00343B990B
MTETLRDHTQQAAHSTDPSTQPSESTVRRLALCLSTGALIWSTSSFVHGFQPTSEIGWTITDLGGLAFQLGLWALVTLMSRTGAIGVTRTARVMLTVERVLLAPAMVWSLIHGLFPAARNTLWLGILDIFWPLSMLGMFVIGIKVAVAGRWRGLARVWPLVAESWAIVSIPAMGILGASIGGVVAATHLLVGYATLGLIIAFRPELVRGED